MSDQVIDKAALEMYRRSRRMAGVKRPEADQEWRDLGAPGRKMWRELALAAFEAITGKNGAAAKPAAKPAAPAAARRPNVFKPF